MPSVYLIAPQVWAWRKSRLARHVRHLLCIFSFEEDFFRNHGLAATYIGHPLTRLVERTPRYDRTWSMRSNRSGTGLMNLAFLLCFVQLSAAAQPASEFKRVSLLPGPDRAEALGAMLTGGSVNWNNLEAFFPYEASLREPLRVLVQGRNRSNWLAAVSLLSVTGDPDDVRFIGRHQLFPQNSAFPFGMLSTLFEPETEADWEMLTQAVRHGLSCLDAIRTLRFIASSRALAVLEEARSANLPQHRKEALEAAIAFISKGAAPMQVSGPDLLALAKRISERISFVPLEAVRKPLFNHAGDRALIDLVFAEPGEGISDMFTYTTCYQRIASTWHLRSLTFRSQSLVTRRVPKVPLVPPPPPLALPDAPTPPRGNQ